MTIQQFIESHSNNLLPPNGFVYLGGPYMHQEYLTRMYRFNALTHDAALIAEAGGRCRHYSRGDVWLLWIRQQRLHIREIGKTITGIAPAWICCAGKGISL